jgi:hypothetical protein
MSSTPSNVVVSTSARDRYQTARAAVTKMEQDPEIDADDPVFEAALDELIIALDEYTKSDDPRTWTFTYAIPESETSVFTGNKGTTEVICMPSELAAMKDKLGVNPLADVVVECMETSEYRCLSPDSQ